MDHSPDIANPNFPANSGSGAGGSLADPTFGGGIPSLYETLGVSPEASRMQVREAYLRLKNTYANGSEALYSLVSEDESRRQMERVEFAFNLLNDDAKRRQYDHQLGTAPSSSSAAPASGPTQDWAEANAAHGVNFSGTSTHHLADTNLAAATVAGDTGGTSPSFLRRPLVPKKVTGSDSDEMRARMETLMPDHQRGGLFRALRELHGVSRTEMQDRIKVSAEYLLAIESDDYTRLPPLVYVKGFLRSFLRYLSVPEPEELVTAYVKGLQEWQKSRK